MSTIDKLNLIKEIEIRNTYRILKFKEAVKNEKG